MQGAQIDTSLIENFSTNRNFSIPTLIEEIKHVVSDEVWFWISSKIKMFSSEFSDQDIDAREKIIDFRNEYSSTGAVFSIEILVQETGGGWELKVWVLSEIKINSTFWNIWTVMNQM